MTKSHSTKFQISRASEMFTGIIQEQGKVVDLKRMANLMVLKLKASKIHRTLKEGDSMAVDGVCLTVTGIRKGILTFDLMRETLLTTTLGLLKKNRAVNLEPALKWGDRLGGHFVTGHVDRMIRLQRIQRKKNFVELIFELDRFLSRFIVPKGSVCINGVSLTVGQRKAKSFSVFLIPFSLKVTNLGQLKPGDTVNIEVDLLAKYLFSFPGKK